jgi:hypothetical protein
MIYIVFNIDFQEIIYEYTNQFNRPGYFNA